MAASAQSDGLSFCAYWGDGALLLAFDLDESRRADLAGFAVEYTDPDGKTFPVLNRLNFGQALTKATTLEQRKYTPTSEAPLQKFHWVHFPPDVKPGNFTYKATAMLFKPGSETDLTPGPSAEQLIVNDTKIGTGKEATPGATVFMHYSGWLYRPLAKNMHGKLFDSSIPRGEPLDFVLGAGRVIKGWDQGVAGMKVGGTRTLVIPPDLGYGERGAGGVIPPNATLIFDVELLDVK